MGKIKIELGPVQKTLLMPVWARAVESKKSNPFISDPIAEKIIEMIDYDFASMGNEIEQLSQTSWIARCLRYDQIIKQFISENPLCVIINIGCGLDTTYERIGNKIVKWYDLDLPDVISLRKKFIKETDNRKFIAHSFLDCLWMNGILREGNCMIISAGVFTYFEEKEIKQFISKVLDEFPKVEMFFDATSVHGIKVANRIIKNIGLTEESYMKWALNNAIEILEWDSRIQLLNTYLTYKIDGLKLSFNNKILAAISDALKIQYMIHLRKSVF